MTRYYLDTNTLIFMLFSRRDLDSAVTDILDDCANIFYTSSVCVHELIDLYQKESLKEYKLAKNRQLNILDLLDNLGIRIIHTTDHHLRQLHQLPLYSDHRDPFDRLIIAQAIVDRIPIITSDRRFDLYLDSNLQLQFNQR